MLLLHIVSWCYLSFSLLAFLIILIDLLMGTGQKMKIMNLVWPISALYLGPFALYYYFKKAKVRSNTKCCCQSSHHNHNKSKHSCCHGAHKKACQSTNNMKRTMHSEHNMKMDHKMEPESDMQMGHIMEMNSGMKMDHETALKRVNPSLKSVFISSLHCGAGCVLGDIIAELIILFAALKFFGAAIWASFFLDYGAALVLGLVFQFYTIAPMQPDLTKGQVLWRALKADFLSLTFFEIGLFGWMLACYFLFSPVLVANQAIFWFMMQLGMILGLLTTMPINYLLIKFAIKSNCSD